MAAPTKSDDTPAVTVLVGENGPEIANASPPKEDSPAVLRYTGDGSTFYHGVPQRDLTKAEAESVKAQRPVIYTAMTTPAEGQDTPLYERIKGGK